MIELDALPPLLTPAELADLMRTNYEQPCARPLPRPWSAVHQERQACALRPDGSPRLPRTKHGSAHRHSARGCVGECLMGGDNLDGFALVDAPYRCGRLRADGRLCRQSVRASGRSRVWHSECASAP